MKQIAQRALDAWKKSDLAATDAEALLRLQVMKYAEGLGPSPEDALVHQVRELRDASTVSLLAALHAIQAAGGLKP